MGRADCVGKCSSFERVYIERRGYGYPGKHVFVKPRYPSERKRTRLTDRQTERKDGARKGDNDDENDDYND